MNNNKQNSKNVEEIKHIFLGLSRELVKSGFSTKELQNACLESNCSKYTSSSLFIIFLVLALLAAATYEYGLIASAVNYFLGIRCIVPNNYFVWEATRPVSDCSFCTNITKPIILGNVTREEFAPFAYSSKPINCIAVYLILTKVWMKSVNFYILNQILYQFEMFLR
jgi:hypothetical protein